MKSYWKSSTVWIGTAFAAIGAFLPLIIELLNYVGAYDFSQAEPNWFLFVSGVVMVIQRWRTSTPINSPLTTLDKVWSAVTKSSKN